MPQVFTIDGPAAVTFQSPLQRSPLALAGFRGAPWGQTDAEREGALLRTLAIAGGVLLAVIIGVEIVGHKSA